MLSDRHYMRENHERSSFSALTWLICIIAAGFVVENIFLRWFSADVADRFFHYTTLSAEGISSGFVWTLFTHGLFHNPDNLLCLGFTLLTLFLLGRIVRPEIGDRGLILVFAAAVAVGGITWLAVNWTHGGVLYGASAGVSALIVLFAFLAPHQPITFFLIDIGMRAKHLAIGLLIIDLIGLVLVEIPGTSNSSWFAMAHSAHLGGMLTGWLYFRYVHQRAWEPALPKASVELPRWLRKARKAETAPPVFKVNVGSGENLRAEIDRILDKINSDGFQSLTPEEKQRLDHARDHLSRR